MKQLEDITESPFRFAMNNIKKGDPKTTMLRGFGRFTQFPDRQHLIESNPKTHENREIQNQIGPRKYRKRSS